MAGVKSVSRSHLCGPILVTRAYSSTVYSSIDCSVIRFNTWPLFPDVKKRKSSQLGRLCHSGSVRYFSSINASRYRLSESVDNSGPVCWNSMSSPSYVKPHRVSGTRVHRCLPSTRIDEIYVSVPCIISPTDTLRRAHFFRSSSPQPPKMKVTLREEPRSSGAAPHNISPLLIDDCNTGMRTELGLEGISSGAVVPFTSSLKDVDENDERVVRMLSEFFSSLFPCLTGEDDRGHFESSYPGEKHSDALWNQVPVAIERCRSRSGVACYGEQTEAMRRSSHWIARIIDQLVLQAIRAKDGSTAVPVVVHRLVQQLIACFQHDDEKRFKECQNTFSRIVEKWLDRTSHTYVAAIVLALQVDISPSFPSNNQTQSENFISAQWHPLVSSTLALRCYQRILLAVKAAKHHPALGALLYNPLPNDLRAQWPRDDELRTLHACLACSLPEDDLCVGDRIALGITWMTGLRFATLTDLTSHFCYLKNIIPGSSFSILCSKFLANSGSSILSTNSALHSTHAPFIRDVLEELIRTSSKERSIKEVEEGLVHGSALLHAMGGAAYVRRMYKELPELRETAHSVAACITLSDVSETLAALSKLGHSQSNGWVYIPGIVAETMASSSRLVGRRGNAGHVVQLYRALISFQNKGMLLSNYIEMILGGVADRMLDIPSRQQDALGTETTHQHHHDSSSVEVSRDNKVLPSLSGEVAPRDVLNVIVPLVEASLLLLGDDVNADVILTLIEASIRSGSYAVPLTVGLMNAMRRAAQQHISMSFFFHPGDDPGYHRTPFLVYFALCTARDFKLRDVFDHLSTIWGVDGDAIWRRAPHLSPSYKLWQCGSCGRRNSDRFNYCACSALRYGIVVCGECGYAQDERWTVCLSCGAAPGSPETSSNEEAPRGISMEEKESNETVSSSSAHTRIIRKSWSCSACNATNPSRQTLLCFRCSKLTGPVGKLQDRKDHASQRNTTDSFCQCLYGAGGTYTSCIGYCHSCKLLKNAFSRTSSYVWRCSGCHHLRSSLERACPRCPHVECVPYLFSHAVSDTRFCFKCHAAHEGKPFEEVCAHCGASDPSFSLVDGVLRTQMVEDTIDPTHPPTIPSNGADNHNVCPPHCCGKQTEGDPDSLSLVCRHCLAYRPSTDVYLRPLDEGPVVKASGSSVAEATHKDEILPVAIVQREAEEQGWASLTQTVLALKEGLVVQCNRGHCLRRSSSSSFNEGFDPLDVDGVLSGVDKALKVISVHIGGDVRGKIVRHFPPQAGEIVSMLEETVDTLKEYFAVSIVARRASALIMSTILNSRGSSHGLKSAIGFQELSHHSGLGRSTVKNICSHCCGTHPDEVCPFCRLTWQCTSCGQENRNDDPRNRMSRYCCKACLSLRPVVRDLHPSFCWTCEECGRSNMEFETYCIYCSRASRHFSLRKVRRDSNEPPPTSIQQEGAGREASTWSSFSRSSSSTSGASAMTQSGATPTASVSALLEEQAGDLPLLPLGEHNHLGGVTSTPFVPAQCHICERVYLEPACPDCSALLRSGDHPSPPSRRDYCSAAKDLKEKERVLVGSVASCISSFASSPCAPSPSTKNQEHVEYKLSPCTLTRTISFCPPLRELQDDTDSDRCVKKCTDSKERSSTI